MKVLTRVKKGLLKKAVSMLVAVCLLVGIANIPAYSAVKALNIANDTQGYNLQTEYLTPAQAAKKALEQTKSKTKTTKAKTATTVVSATVKNDSSLLSSAYTDDKDSKYNKTMDMINELSKKELESSVIKMVDKTKTFLSEIVNSGMSTEKIDSYIEQAYSIFSSIMKDNNYISLHPAAVGLHLGMRFNNTVYPLKSFVESIEGVVVYSDKGFEAINGLAKNLGLDQNTAFEQFTKAGVTKEQLDKVADTLINQINKGENFITSSVASLSKYLNADEKLVAVQQLAVAITKGSDINSNSSLEEQLSVIKMNGKTNSDIYTNCTLDELISNLKIGEGAILKVQTQKGDSSISVIKQSDNSFVVRDEDFVISPKTSDGTVVFTGVVDCVYTEAEFKKLMSYQTASFTFTLPNGMKGSGTRLIDYKATNGEGKINFISNSAGIKEKEQARLQSKYVDLIDNLINILVTNSNTPKLGKTWLKQAKILVNNIFNGQDGIAEKEAKLKEALSSMQTIADNNAWVSILMQESSKGTVFSSLSSVLKTDKTIKEAVYPMFENYVQPAISAINNMLKSDDSSDATKAVLNSVKNLMETKLDEVITLANSGKDFSQQQQWLNNALSSIQTIQENNASISILEQETATGKVFSSLRETLENTTTYKAYQKYEEEGSDFMRRLAKYVNVVEDVIYDAFVQLDVTLEKLNKAIPTLSDLMDKGASFFNCASLAVSKYLSINKTLAGIQNLAADIALGNPLGVDKTNTLATNISGEIKVLRANGHEKADEVMFDDVDKLMAGLKVGESAILTVYCYDLGGHAITVKKEANGYGVFDVNRNGGEEVIYTAENFKKVMTGAKDTVVEGKTTDGRTFSSKVYYNAITTKQKYVINGTNITVKWETGVYAIKDVDSAQNTNTNSMAAAKKETKETNENTTMTTNKTSTAKQKIEEAKKKAEEAKKKAEEAKKAAQEKAALLKKQAEEKIKAAQAKAAEAKKKAEETKKALLEKLNAAKKRMK